MSKKKQKKSENTVDFIGIGAAKSGSSWVARCLLEHPDIGIPQDKSLFFFNSDHGHQYIKDNYSHYPKGIGWYLSWFPSYKEVDIRGEFGVSYLNDKAACNRIKKHFPDVKILVTLRNPADMVYSLYWFSRNTVEISVPKDFETAVNKEFYLNRGLYYKYLKNYFDIFNKENIYVIIYDDIRNNPKKVTRELYEYLGADADFVPSILNKRVYPSIGSRSQVLKNLGFLLFYFLKFLKLDFIRKFVLDHRIFYKVYRRINVVTKKYPPMKKSARKKLIKYYSKDIADLEKLIDRDLSMWKEV